MRTSLRSALIFLGYSTNPNMEENDNELGFFKYDDFTEEEKQDFLGFQKHNEKVMAEIGTLREVEEFIINQDKPVDSLVNHKSLEYPIFKDCKMR